MLTDIIIAAVSMVVTTGVYAIIAIVWYLHPRRRTAKPQQHEAQVMFAAGNVVSITKAMEARRNGMTWHEVNTEWTPIA